MLHQRRLTMMCPLGSCIFYFYLFLLLGTVVPRFFELFPWSLGYEALIKYPRFSELFCHTVKSSRGSTVFFYSDKQFLPLLSIYVIVSFLSDTHRTVLNQILRQSSNPLSVGPFAVLVNHTRLLDFDVKRRYFRQELEKEDKV